VILAALFFIGIVLVSFEQWVLSYITIIGFVSLFFTNKEKRFMISLLFSFLIGYAIFLFFANSVETLDITKEVRIILNRLFLAFIIIAVSINHLIYNKKITWYNNKPNWKNQIVLPFHKIDTFTFWVIGIVVNVIVYLFLILQKDLDSILSLFFFCLLFTLINAVFEELIWRGIMLSSLMQHTSSFHAIIMTSVGFGLLHLAIGFSLFFCLLISIAGVIYATITIKTNSIYPSIVFHMVINIGMVYSGLII